MKILVACALLLAFPALEAQDPAGNTTLPANVTAPPANTTTLNSTDAPAPNTTSNTTNAVLPAASVPPPDSAGCKSTCRRREIRNLSAGERTALFNAIRKLMEGTAPTKYDQLVKNYIDNASGFHNTAYFAPWNRAFLREFERALQAIDASVCLPYWNFSVDSQAPENSPIFGNDYYGGNGGADGCVSSGPFATWKPAYPQPHCLQRKWKYGDNLGAFHSIESINKIVSGSSDYDTFHGKLETVITPTPHCNVGGDLGEIHSANDPLFWVHRAYIDYIWTQWQAKRKGGNFSGSNGSGGKASASDDLKGLSYKVEQVLDTSKLCYGYADMADSDLEDPALPSSNVAKPSGDAKPDGVTVEQTPTNDDDLYSSKDRSRLNIVRYPDQADDSYCGKFKYDVGKVRGYEDECKQMYKNLNKIKGYVSPCSLWKRPSLCRPILAKKTPVYVDVPDYGQIKVEYSDADPYQALSNVRQKTLYTSSDVDLPPSQYKDKLQDLVGPSAFGGAGTLTKIVNEMDVSNPASKAVTTAVSAMGMCAALMLPMAMLYA